MHREVNLTKRVQTAQGLRYCPVVMSANGRVKPDVVLVDGKEEKHPEGAYYIEWRDAGRRTGISSSDKRFHLPIRVSAVRIWDITGG